MAHIYNLRTSRAYENVDEKGRRRKKYETYQTPRERLKAIMDVVQYLREGVTLEALGAIAARQTDNEAAAAMQEARNRLFKRFGAGRDAAARSIAARRPRR